MELGLFLEFPVREGSNENEAFKESFALVDQAEDLGVASVWMAEYHFNPARVLASPLTILTAVGRSHDEHPRRTACCCCRGQPGARC